MGGNIKHGSTAVPLSLTLGSPLKVCIGSFMKYQFCYNIVSAIYSIVTYYSRSLHLGNAYFAHMIRSDILIFKGTYVM